MSFYNTPCLLPVVTNKESSQQVINNNIDDERPIKSQCNNKNEQHFLIGCWTQYGVEQLFKNGCLQQECNNAFTPPPCGLYHGVYNKNNKQIVVDGIMPMRSPSWITFSKTDINICYIVHENSEGFPGEVSVARLIINNNETESSSTAIKTTTTGLSILQTLPTFGEQPTHSALNRDESFIAICNYGADLNTSSIVIYPVDPTTKCLIENQSQVITCHVGTAVDPNGRQESGHAHCALWCTPPTENNQLPSREILFVPDLGADVVHAFEYSEEAKKFIPNTTLQLNLPPGSGPRHAVLTADGMTMFVVTEMMSNVHVFQYNKNLEKYCEIINNNNGSSPPIRPDELYLYDREAKAKYDSEFGPNIDFVGGSGIILDRTERYLYVMNRGKVNSITVYNISYQQDIVGPILTVIQRVPTNATGPRSFCLSPDETMAFVPCVEGNQTVVFVRDIETGLLSIHPTATIEFQKPTHVVFF